MPKKWCSVFLLTHTASDKVPDGVSGAMAARLGLVNLRILNEDRPGSGLGMIGELPTPISADEAVKLVKNAFSLKSLRSSRSVDKPIRTIAVCGGSGASLINDAREQGADLYVSGDISYHRFFLPEGFMVMDIGHYESERDIVDILFSLLTKKFPNFAVRISENINSNPIFYF